MTLQTPMTPEQVDLLEKVREGEPDVAVHLERLYREFPEVPSMVLWFRARRAAYAGRMFDARVAASTRTDSSIR
jgi:hypothetical protein